MTLPTSTPTKRIVLIAVGGPTCSGKTLFAKHLAKILPNTVIIHQDDYAPPQEDVPYSPAHPHLQDWDHPPTAILWPLFRRSLIHARQTGQPLPEVNGHDHLNKQVEVEIGEEVGRRWKGRFEGLVEEEKGMGREVEFVIVDGFLLYWDEECAKQYDVMFFLRVPYDTLKRRREERQTYVTQTGDVWTDPPNYFDDIVYPAYKVAHEKMFVGGDVEAGEMKGLSEVYGEKEGKVTETGMDDKDTGKGKGKEVRESEDGVEVTGDESSVGFEGKELVVFTPIEGSEGMEGMLQEGLARIFDAVRAA